MKMGDCELCGAMKVGTQSVLMGRAEVQSCKRCVEKLGLSEKKVAPGLQRAMQGNSAKTNNSGKKGKNIMLRGEKELSPDFAKIVTKARELRGWDKRELAKRTAEKFNIIQSLESGKRPTDSVIRKLERTLDIVLMVDIRPDENRQINSGNIRGMTLGDFLLGDKD